MYKKGVNVMKLKKLLSFVCCLVFIFTFAVSNVYAATSTDKSVIDNYLTEAGFPAYIIEILPESIKEQYYDEKVEFETCSTTYGILTEEHSINYTINEEQQIVIDDENLSKFYNFVDDSEAVNRVLESKQIDFVNGSTLKSNKLESSAEKINVDTTARMLTEFTNWFGSLLVTRYYERPDDIAKNVVYIWSWDYMPVCTLTDKMAIAWSDGFEADPNTIKWGLEEYTTVYDGDEQITGLFGGAGYNEYEPAVGFGKSIDIHLSIRGYAVHYRVGYLSGKIQKNLIGDEIGAQQTASAVGRYYHQFINVDGVLSFGGDGPSIDITWKSCYEKSPDSGAIFKYFSYLP